MADRETRIDIGTVGRPHGIRGEVRLWLHNRKSDLLDRKVELLGVAPDGREETWHVTMLLTGNEKSGRVVRLAEVKTREDAEARVGWRVFVSLSSLPALPEDEFYYHELPGFEVVTPLGRRVGVVRYVAETSVDVLAIETSDGGELLVPVVGDFVVSIEKPRRRVVVAEDIEARYED